MTEFDEYTSNFDRLRLEFERELTYFETKNEQGKKKHLEKLLSPDHPLIKQSQDWIECYETALQDLPISERMKFQHALFDFKKFLEDLRNQSKSRLDKLTRETLQANNGPISNSASQVPQIQIQSFVEGGGRGDVDGGGANTLTASGGGREGGRGLGNVGAGLRESGGSEAGDGTGGGGVGGRGGVGGGGGGRGTDDMIKNKLKIDEMKRKLDDGGDVEKRLSQDNGVRPCASFQTDNRDKENRQSKILWQGGSPRGEAREELNATSLDIRVRQTDDIQTDMDFIRDDIKTNRKFCLHIWKNIYETIVCRLLSLVVLLAVFAITIVAAVHQNFGADADTGDGWPSSLVDRCVSC
eukprot:TRINITY_DN10779_c0_g1_i1.p1 TRINITY_DN10779_c0_g1~~TRINITY_DN10779_c0_g1_i1.p1  ORF type:complete len:354 (+),score=80.42 TRINITY_DN10779_c0_g1_i1:101-1162(+)